jgi:hypothetical protein
MDDLQCERAGFDTRQPVDFSSLSSGILRISGAAHLHVPDDHLHFCDVDHLLSKLKMHNGAVMLSEAKHLCSLAVSRWRQIIRDGKPGLADFVRCVAASLRSE